ASTVPNCRAYDPAFAYEVAMIVDEGMREMIERQHDVFYYLTVTNENYAQPSPPSSDVDSVRDGVLKGMYPLDVAALETAQVQLLGSGAIFGEVQAAARMLKDDWQIEAAVWSVTSFTELHRDGVSSERAERLFDADETTPYVTSALAASRGPVIAATDYVRAVPELIRAYVPRRYATLGTDGFGRSDTRAALRAFFEVDRASIAIAALKSLADEGVVSRDTVRQALELYGRLDADRRAPWEK
ncbi:transketolase-like TK C-terminal-containing protein, partial [Pararobbsia alpina]